MVKFIESELVLLKKEIDEMFMRRCLQLAKNGRENFYGHLAV